MKMREVLLYIFSGIIAGIIISGTFVMFFSKPEPQTNFLLAPWYTIEINPSTTKMKGICYDVGNSHPSECFYTKDSKVTWYDLNIIADKLNKAEITMGIKGIK